jgi:hypothetical protein
MNRTIDEFYVELDEKLNNTNYTRIGNFFYLINIGDGYFKYGVSFNVINRLTTHFHKFHFQSIVDIWECGKYMRIIESCVKRYAYNNEIDAIYNQYTEILKTDNIKIIVEFVNNLLEVLPKDDKSIEEINKTLRAFLVAKGIHDAPKYVQNHADKCYKIDDIRHVRNDCNFCSKIFIYEDSLKRHLKSCEMRKIYLKEEENKKLIEEERYNNFMLRIQAVTDWEEIKDIHL